MHVHTCNCNYKTLTIYFTVNIYCTDNFNCQSKPVILTVIFLAVVIGWAQVLSLLIKNPSVRPINNITSHQHKERPLGVCGAYITKFSQMHFLTKYQL